MDDEPLGRRVLARQLRERGFEIDEAEDGTTALALLARADGPRMALVDWNMHTIDGPQLCRLLRARTPYVYVVLTTARSGRQPLIEAMNSGADGYLQKPTEIDEVEAWLSAGQRIVDLQDRLLQVQTELERRATHDALTGVFNRAASSEALRRELSRTRRTGRPVAVVALDIDHFKRVNDTYGHSVGDEVLKEFARRCIGAVRDYDIFGRYGGEEFLLVLPGGSLSDGRAAAERILAAVAAQPFVGPTYELAVTASAGVASSVQGHASMESLLEAADSAMYQAKRTGRARVVSAAETEAPPGG
ncbi:MAG TPA: diguanylate cyclase [Polyangiaceae bacterium]|nr:diguanylate cyclase [Polyangiaceae bacterium]